MAAATGIAAYCYMRKRYKIIIIELKKNIDNWQYVQLPPTDKEVASTDFKQLAEAQEELLAKVRSLAQEIQLTSQQVRAASNQVETSVASVCGMKEALRQMQDLAATLQQTCAGLEGDFSASKEATSRVQDAMGRINETVQAITGDNNEMKQHIDTLESAVAEVRLIAENIGDISGRTKMLALNASIEAARAGAHGRGFSVVAGEIGKLSDHTAGAVRQAFNLLEGMKSNVDTVVSSITGSLESSAMVAQQLKDIEETFTGSFKILQRVNDIVVESFLEANKSLQSSSEALETRFKDLEKIENTGKLMSKLAGNLEQVADRNRLSYVINQEIDLRIKTVKELLTNTAGQVDIINMQPNRHENILTGIKKDHPYLEAIWSNDHTGNFIFSLPPAGLAYAGVREWWRRSMAGDKYTSEIYISAITRQPCITVSVPICDKRGVTGVLGADVKLT
ncbi:methyl-accepting chemotaxis sensory transducer with Cache sensor [Desulfallas thermosapovorans DSM 6562]|uniref:Methyl-accepting chemotaxis sensory transducer with Cache sensor n=1 Tax=Desulfallas thermosapovorans DSM 6562 TaxID=1121431 RepID=A0A5S4ZPD2_9FIRM|nr:methyl-accepting chemotaxis sensory transducer with Cache sensor [Desulfallas thermosapovorans DSM 6562]